MMSVSPPPAGAGLGLRPAGDTIWKLSPLSEDLATKPCAVEKAQGTVSQMFPNLTMWTSGSPSVRCGSPMVCAPQDISPVGKTGVGVGPPGVRGWRADRVQRDASA